MAAGWEKGGGTWHSGPAAVTIPAIPSERLRKDHVEEYGILNHESD